MKKNSLLIIFLLLASFLQAQYKVTFIVRERTYIHHDSIYITGTFSNWDSTYNIDYLMKPYGENQKSITLNLKSGPIRYKFTRGNWFKVEKGYSGDEVPDRVLTIHRDTTLTDSVVAWRDLILTDKRQALSQNIPDTAKVRILGSMASVYAFFPEYYNSDSALYYAQTALQVQQNIIASDDYKTWVKAGYTNQLIDIQEVLALLMHSLGNYQKSLDLRLENLKLAEKEKDKFIIVEALESIKSDYLSVKDYQKVLFYGKSMDSVLNSLDTSDKRFKFHKWRAKETIARAYYNLHLLDSALAYAKSMEGIITPHYNFQFAFGFLLLGDIYAAKGEEELAFDNYKKSLPNAGAILANTVIAGVHAGMARLFQKRGKLDSAIFYARKSLNYFQNNQLDVRSWGENSDYYVAEITPLVADLYRQNNQMDSAYKYLQMSVALRDSLYNIDKIRQFQTLGFNESSRRQQLDQQTREAKERYQSRIKIYSLIGGLAAVLILAFIFYRNNKQKQKANTILQSQKQEIEATLVELKTTQKQLIQSEKMASLGELTAGIAHEIQNPLNFINNFSEVNTELIEEMKTELKAGNINSAVGIADSISDNEQKINHHGKRADGIVKGMLQHSRSSSGVKEPTDINKLTDEYLRLAYHGLRAKDKSFNATIKTDFDNNIGTVNIIPQDIGRVVLNLITNAFYVVNERKNKEGKSFEPTVTVSTKKAGTKVLIKVKDNGNGIPQNILDKIFQPFFTTKPTGQGTGLGLSLSYDIVKAHGGELTAKNKEEEGAEFTITLPC